MKYLKLKKNISIKKFNGELKFIFFHKPYFYFLLIYKKLAINNETKKLNKNYKTKMYTKLALICI